MLGKTIAKKYKITAQVGAGGMGCVYRAEHNVLGRQSALKVLHAQLNSDKTFIERFMREARAMARLDHDNIVRIYDVFEENSLHFIAMELFEGPSLKTVIENHGRLSLEQSVSIISQCARGLAYAHAQGIVHRDIKPSNIMLNSEGRIKITDFGIAAAMDDAATLTNTGQLVGTPRYMSPEQAKNGDIDRRSDLYSLGIVFFELVTGRTPFDGESGVAIIGKLAYESTELELDFSDAIPNDMRDLIRKMLLRHQEERIQHATHLMGEISKLSIKPGNIDNTINSSLSLVAIEELKEPSSSFYGDQTEVLSNDSSLSANNDAARSQPFVFARESDISNSVSQSTPKRNTATIAAVAMLFISVIGGLVYLSYNDDLTNFPGAMPNDAERDIAIAVQKGLYQLLEKKTAVEVVMGKASDAGAAQLSGSKFGSASDKFLIAEGAINAIERDIKNKRYKKAEISIARAQNVFNAALQLFEQSQQEAVSGTSEDFFAATDSLKKLSTVAARKVRNEKFTGAFKNNYEKALRLKKQATRNYDKAKLQFASKNITNAKISLANAQRDYSEAETIFINLAGFIQGQNAIDKVYSLRSKLGSFQFKIISSKETANKAFAKKMAAAKYQKASSLHRQLTARTKDANYLLRDKDYRIAGIQFKELIALSEQVINEYNAAAVVAQKQQSLVSAQTTTTETTPVVEAIKTAKARRPSQRDLVAVERLLHDFKLVYESRNIERLKSIVDLSPQRLETAKAIFSQFNEIHLSVTSYSLVSGGATANVRIDRVVTPKGDNVVPSKKWRDGKLELIQNGDGWGKIVWR